MKAFLIANLNDLETLKGSSVKDLTVVAKRLGDILVTDFFDFPERSITVNFNPLNGRISLEFCLKNNEFLAIGDKE
jgi:hypothetical protein